MHRDYSIAGSQVQVEVYDDRVEVINPGGLPEGVSRKTLGDLSIRRNERISDMFFRLHKVEKVGMGIKRMRKMMREAGLREPEFETEGFFRAVFYRPEPQAIFPESETVGGSGARATISDTLRATIKATIEGLPDNERKILEQMRRNPKVTADALAKMLGITSRNIKRNIDKLKKKGLLRRVGSRKAGHWEALEHRD
jgi:ATP-dependent DNA helicase RecG